MSWDADRIAVTGGSAGANLALGLLTLAGRRSGPAVSVDRHCFDSVDHDFHFARSTPTPTLTRLMALISDHLLTHLR